MVLSSLAHYRGPLRPHHSPRRAAHRPASHSPRAAHRACLRLRRRYLRLMSKVRSRWGYALQCPPCPKLRPTADRRARATPQAANDILTLTSLLRLLGCSLTPKALHKWGKTKCRRGHERGRRSRGVQHGGKGLRRRVGEPRHHHCRHRTRRCNLMPGAAQKMHWPRRTNGRQPGSPPGAHAPA